MEGDITWEVYTPSTETVPSVMINNNNFGGTGAVDDWGSYDATSSVSAWNWNNPQTYTWENATPWNEEAGDTFNSYLGDFSQGIPTRNIDSDIGNFFDAASNVSNSVYREYVADPIQESLDKWNQDNLPPEPREYTHDYLGPTKNTGTPETTRGLWEQTYARNEVPLSVQQSIYDARPTTLIVPKIVGDINGWAGVNTPNPLKPVADAFGINVPSRVNLVADQGNYFVNSQVLAHETGHTIYNNLPSDQKEEVSKFLFSQSSNNPITNQVVKSYSGKYNANVSSTLAPTETFAETLAGVVEGTGQVPFGYLSPAGVKTSDLHNLEKGLGSYMDLGDEGADIGFRNQPSPFDRMEKIPVWDPNQTNEISSESRMSSEEIADVIRYLRSQNEDEETIDYNYQHGYGGDFYPRGIGNFPRYINPASMINNRDFSNSSTLKVVNYYKHQRRINKRITT